MNALTLASPHIPHRRATCAGSRKIKCSSIFILPLLLTAITLAQNSPPLPSVNYVSSANPGQARIAGTSSLHDWSAQSPLLTGSLAATGPWTPNALPSLQAITFSIPVNSLKSTEGAAMDEAMHEALKLKQQPDISFSLVKAALATKPLNHDPAFHFAVSGNLKIAGKSRPVDLDLAVTPHADGGLTITVATTEKMTDFGITPPTALFGAIRSGDQVRIDVTWHVKIKPPDQK